MIIYIASDHAGYNLKKQLIEDFPNIEWKDLGPQSVESVDYPDYAALVTKEIETVEKENAKLNRLDSLDGRALGVLICGSGQGMAIRANRSPYVRAALCWSTEVVSLAREHNNANVLCMGAKLISTETAAEILKTFLTTRFAGGRHLPRVKKLFCEV